MAYILVNTRTILFFYFFLFFFITYLFFTELFSTVLTVQHTKTYIS